MKVCASESLPLPARGSRYESALTTAFDQARLASSSEIAIDQTPEGQMKLDDLFRARPALATELYLAASEIVDDFQDYGSVIQANVEGKYDGTTTIRRLALVRDRIIDLLRSG
jgi:hypothetical protein